MSESSVRVYNTLQNVKRPREEEKLAAAALRSFSSRNPVHVTSEMRTVAIRDSVLVEVSWFSSGEEHSNLTWRVTVLFDEGMMTPGNHVKLDVIDTDGVPHHYTISRRTLDTVMGRRLGYDYTEEVIRTQFPDYWEFLGGQLQKTYYVVPTAVQWSYGQFGFARLKKEVSAAWAESTFFNTDSDERESYTDLNHWLTS